MSFPQQGHLPKPPPKALPGARVPLGKPPITATAARPLAGPAPVQTAVAAPSIHAVAAAKPSQALPSASASPPAARPMPPIDTKGLPATLVPMVEAIRLYDELLCEENDALRSGDSKAVEALLDRKMAATRLYQERLRNLLGDPKNTRVLTPEQRASVIAQVRCLEERTKENTVLLKANMSAIEQLFEVINTAARKMRRQEVAYSKAGKICDNYNRNGVSLAYNHTI